MTLSGKEMENFRTLDFKTAMKRCKKCNETYNRPTNISQKQWDSRKYCSYACLHTRLGHKWTRNINIFERPCSVCKTFFIKRKHEPQWAFEARLYCSRKCYLGTKQKSGTPIKICGVCHVSFTRPKGLSYKLWEQKIHCSRKCYSSFSQPKIFSGEGNPAWRGGLQTLSDKLRNTRNYRWWRDAVLLKSDNSCVQCGRKDNIEVDHIVPFSYFLNLIRSEFPESVWFETALNYKPLWDTKNGRTLCIDCHKKTPTYAGGAKKFQNICNP